MLQPRLDVALGTMFLFATGFLPQGRSPQAAVDELLAVDRAFSTASAKTDLISGITPMFTDDVVMGPIPGNKFAYGIAEVRAALNANPDNAGSRLEWTPIRGGVSSDGRHGFTFGYMTLHKADKSVVPVKYLAYWIKQPEGWRVAVYKRGRRAEGPVSMALLPGALPSSMVAPSNDASALERFRESLDQAERAFSDEAQKIGLGAAFAKYGTADAVNMGGPNEPGFVVGSEAIGRAVSAGDPPGPSPVSWAPDRVIVAGSGDLGVTIGMIQPNAKAADGSTPAGFPFFTIWRRATTKDPWRYVAE